ncbi:MAG: chromosomal replication initiator protein DnaA [candidate division Zixibacteria bacterium]|nr:chromosomal replication initiator protein DnaA [candidate division Zixibacteria bacterium]
MLSEPEAIWSECLDFLEKRVKRQSFYTWLRPTKLFSQNEALHISVPNRFVAEWLEEHYRPLITEAIKETFGEAVPFSFKVSNEKADFQLSPPPANGTNGAPLPKPAAGTEVEPYRKLLNPRYTFESFVRGDSNLMAHAVAVAVSEAPGKTRYNPLYFYGGVGLGKTHLLQAIGHAVLDDNPFAKVLYVTSERFTSDFINSLSNNTTQEFTHFYRQADVLLLDDIQFLVGKESTQVQFFHTFNTLHQAGKQIVLSSDRPPALTKGLEERLLSRFQWGMTVDIQPPDLETRIAILRKKSESDKLSIGDEVITFIAENVTSNIRELEGCLIRLLAYSSLWGKDINIELAKEVLRDHLKASEKRITIEAIHKRASEHFKLAPELLLAKKKTQEVAMARQVGMYLSRLLTDHSLKSIGSFFGGRDHSTVIHACEIVSGRMKTDSKFRQEIEQLIIALSN